MFGGGDSLSAGDGGGGLSPPQPYTHMYDLLFSDWITFKVVCESHPCDSPLAGPAQLSKTVPTVLSSAHNTGCCSRRSCIRWYSGSSFWLTAHRNPSGSGRFVQIQQSVLATARACDVLDS